MLAVQMPQLPQMQQLLKPGPEHVNYAIPLIMSEVPLYLLQKQIEYVLVLDSPHVLPVFAL